jgi:hypothetical protein
MRKPIYFFPVASLLVLSIANAADYPVLQTDFALSLEHDELDHISLGNDPGVEKLVHEDYEFEFRLRYDVSEQLYLFFGASLVDETETLKPVDIEEQTSGLERKEMGVGFYFGEELESELRLGRVEIVSASEWWIWWDEDLDAITLDSRYGEFEILLGVAKEQARESTDVDFIDPEQDDVQRIIASLGWEISPEQSLNFYYLDQSDNSGRYLVGDFEKTDEIDDADADLSWVGISYLGEFDNDAIGEIELELHVAEVRGDETVYGFGDPDLDTGRSEVEEIEKGRVSGSAQSYLVSWTPAALDDWSFVVGGAEGSGDGNPDDRRDDSFRQAGLQGDADVYGELYEPEISNMRVQVIGVEWEISDTIEVALFSYDYEQDEKSDDIRDVNIDLDPSGLSRDLGSEIDLVFTIEAYEGLEVTVIVAEFEAGKAYGLDEGETSNYISFELSYEF